MVIILKIFICQNLISGYYIIQTIFLTKKTMDLDKKKKLETTSRKLISNFVIEKIKDNDRIFWLINVNWVKISSDLSYLDVFVSSFENTELLTKTLAKYARDMENIILKNLEMRKVPRVRFRYDEKWEIGQKVIAEINKLEIKDID